MIEHKHTPGPWVIDRCNITQGGKWTSDQDVICYINREVTGQEQDGFACCDAVEANGYLISAAPDMLEMLEELIHMNECAAEGIFPPSANKWHAAYNKAFEIVENAKGKIKTKK